MKDSLVSSRYIEALVQSVEKKEIESVLTALIQLIDIIETEDFLWDVLKSPVIDKRKKESILSELLPVLSTNKHFKNFILLLVTKDRLSLLKTMKYLVKNALLDAKNQIEVVVDTTDGFGKKEQEMLTKYLKDVTQKDISLSINIKDNMLGGFKATVDNILYDGTVENALDKLKLSFK